MVRSLLVLAVLACAAGVAAAGNMVGTFEPTMSPTKAPTKARTKAPTKSPIKPLPRCKANNYVDTRSRTCKKCVTSGSPFRTTRGRVPCYLSQTLSNRSQRCGPIVLPVGVRNYKNSRTTTSCIKPRTRIFYLVLPISSPKYSFLSAGAYTKASIRVAGAVQIQRPPSGFAASTKTVNGRKRFVMKFDDRFGALKFKKNKVVELTGVINRPGNFDLCFRSFVRVCKS